MDTQLNGAIAEYLEDNGFQKALAEFSQEAAIGVSHSQVKHGAEEAGTLVKIWEAARRLHVSLLFRGRELVELKNQLNSFLIGTYGTVEDIPRPPAYSLTCTNPFAPCASKVFAASPSLPYCLVLHDANLMCKRRDRVTIWSRSAPHTAYVAFATNGRSYLEVIPPNKIQVYETIFEDYKSVTCLALPSQVGIKTCRFVHNAPSPGREMLCVQCTDSSFMLLDPWRDSNNTHRMNGSDTITCWDAAYVSKWFYLFAGTNNGRIIIWKAHHSVCLCEVQAHKNRVENLRIIDITPEKVVRFSTSSREPIVILWEYTLDGAKLSRLKNLIGHSNWVLAMAVNQHFLFTASDDGVMYTWNLRSPEFNSTKSKIPRVDAMEAEYGPGGLYVLINGNIFRIESNESIPKLCSTHVERTDECSLKYKSAANIIVQASAVANKDQNNAENKDKSIEGYKSIDLSKNNTDYNTEPPTRAETEGIPEYFVPNSVEESVLKHKESSETIVENTAQVLSSSVDGENTEANTSVSMALCETNSKQLFNSIEDPLITSNEIPPNITNSSAADREDTSQTSESSVKSNESKQKADLNKVSVNVYVESETDYNERLFVHDPNQVNEEYINSSQCVQIESKHPIGTNSAGEVLHSLISTDVREDTVKEGTNKNDGMQACTRKPSELLPLGQNLSSRFDNKKQAVKTREPSNLGLLSKELRPRITRTSEKSVSKTGIPQAFATASERQKFLDKCGTVSRSNILPKICGDCIISKQTGDNSKVKVKDDDTQKSKPTKLPNASTGNMAHRKPNLDIDPTVERLLQSGRPPMDRNLIRYPSDAAKTNKPTSIKAEAKSTTRTKRETVRPGTK